MCKVYLNAGFCTQQILGLIGALCCLTLQQSKTARFVHFCKHHESKVGSNISVTKRILVRLEVGQWILGPGPVLDARAFPVPIPSG